jgi:Amidohydrolase
MAWRHAGTVHDDGSWENVGAGTSVMGELGDLGIVLDHGHQRHIDMVAARCPELQILAARPAYPWQDEMIAVLLHKGNVSYELHGWSPKAFSPALKREIGGRLQDRIMFGCDYPVLKYEMMAERWRSLGYSEAVLEKVFHLNADRFSPGAKNVEFVGDAGLVIFRPSSAAINQNMPLNATRLFESRLLVSSNGVRFQAKRWKSRRHRSLA